ncbi:MAG: D-alanyl-D-alanine carboxypeptidase, partial [Cyclobacteriaceae bacterium]|nr:D-alanyl-D-alanine carboxypeptidase [Cyclobacteriaceae bacterium HetDA_MAG_MS6]
KPIDEPAKYGPGWAWDDFPYAYQPERSAFPIYGNVVRISRDTIAPAFFEAFIDSLSDISYPRRDHFYNIFSVPPRDSLDSGYYEVPYISNAEILSNLLADTLMKKVTWIDKHVFLKPDTLYNEHKDPVLAMMMKRSDNFLAEQLLINSQLRRAYPSLSKYREYAKDVIFKYTSDPLIWVDGSGLSRYNLSTPRNMVQILHELYKTHSWDYLISILAVGGESGTIKNWYAAESPYVFAKTGTLRHNHALSGYLKARSGKILIFSFMNNHYTSSSAKIKIQMQELLEKIRDAY